MLAPSQIVNHLRKLTDPEWTTPIEEGGRGYTDQQTLESIRIAFGELDRGLSFGAAVPMQWDRHKDPDIIEDEIEYWRGR
jgi:hypothetical protein